jgi:hypothetical protein
MKKNYSIIFVICLLLSGYAGAQIADQTTTQFGNVTKLNGKSTAITGPLQNAVTKHPDNSLSYTNFPAAPTILKISPDAQHISSAVGCQCWVTRDSSFNIVPFTNGTPPEYRNDDGSTNAIQLPFTFCFYGTNVNTIYINNNGNISFGAPYATFSASPFPDPNFVMVAPFWADVDTRDTASGLVYYSLTPTHLIVQWEAVGYYAQHIDMNNTFQLIITDGTDPIISGGLNVAFCYGDMQWTTGDASQGVLGFGGIPATVGVNLGGASNSYIQVGQFDSAGTAYDGPFGNVDEISFLDNQTFVFDACVSSTNLPPLLSTLNACDTLHICSNDTIGLALNFLSPEQGQITSGSLPVATPGISLTTNTAGNPLQMVVTMNGPQIFSALGPGIHQFTVDATDNGVPARTTSSIIIFDIQPGPVAGFSFLPANPGVNASVSFTNTSTLATSYIWDFGDGTIDSVNANPSHIYTSPGTYTVTLTAHSNSGCADNVITQQITVITCASATFTANDVCANDPSTITFTGVASGSAIFTWNFDGGTIISGSGQGPYTVSWAVAGIHTLTLSINDQGCVVNGTFNVNVGIIPTAVISPAGPFAICGGTTVTLSTTVNPGYTCQWYNGSTAIPGATTSQLVVSTPGNYTVEIYYGNCDATSQPVTVNAGGANLNPVVTSDQGIGCNPNYIYNGYGNPYLTLTVTAPGAVAYLWSTGETTQDIQVTTSGTYTVVCYDAAGCSSSGSPNSSIQIVAVNAICGQHDQKVVLCHVPPGNPSNKQTLCIAPSAVPAHLANHPGDCLGPCDLYPLRLSDDMHTGAAGAENIFVYPNPSSGDFTIHSHLDDEAIITIRIFDVAGRIIEILEGKAQDIKFGKDLLPGVYFAEARSDDNITTIRLIKSR